jgi:16S rRNA (cytidine1402-2'-O)-methyltransferase
MPLYVVATPIGNLEDLTPRATRVLREAEVIYCEDTRHSRRLLDHIGVRAPLRALHDHNEDRQAAVIADDVAAGKSIAMISDAGTPCISDPGFALVRELRRRGLPVVSIPGCSAVITFLAAAGLPTDSFQFVGFAPRKHQARLNAIHLWLGSPMPTVLYESPNRIVELLAELSAIEPERQIVLARELTKLHEEWLHGTAAHVHSLLASRDAVKGEVVLGIAGRAEAATSNDELQTWVNALSATELRTKEIASILSDRLSVPGDEVYRRVLAVRAVEKSDHSGRG